ncbi:glycosyltransferase family 2 protein [Winogradskyella sp. PAMC22761]|nr:glycosyltransferase family 2 protein [Winogradskyella sp. PAMC22761]
MTDPLVSIIIPTFNRAHLIGETLDSVLAQTYQNWECIVVDDGSTDHTTDLMQTYCSKDSRFQYHHRPILRPKGANACRNIGLEKSIGAYIVFFDSDDLMTIDHLEIKMLVIQKFNLDYIVTKTQYFNYDNKGLNKYYQFNKYPITAYNYVVQKINWLTLDVCLKSEIAKHVRFNEKLQSGQEFNYFCKLVLITTKAKFIDKTTSLRRYHEGSIRSNLKSRSQLRQSSFKSNWYTYLDIIDVANKEIRCVLIKKCIELVHDEKGVVPVDSKRFRYAVFRELGLKGVFYPLMLTSLKHLNKGYVFRRLLIK